METNRQKQEVVLRQRSFLGVCDHRTTHKSYLYGIIGRERQRDGFSAGCESGKT